MPSTADKTTLRRALRTRRAAHDPGHTGAASTALVDAIRDHPAWRSATAVSAFVGVRGEPDTRPLLQFALAEGRRLWLPRVLDGKAGRSELLEVRDLDELAPAPFGLLEPQPRPGQVRLPTVPPGGVIDLVLVPGLAFSRAGARIGFGAGHYDRLLAPVAEREHPVRMGVCFGSFLDPPEGPIPMAEHDVPMHWVATERGVHRCPVRTESR